MNAHLLHEQVLGLDHPPPLSHLGIFNFLLLIPTNTEKYVFVIRILILIHNFPLIMITNLFLCNIIWKLLLSKCLLDQVPVRISPFLARRSC